MRSPVAGGFTFAEDPSRPAAEARLIWSAAVDPGVLVASATPAPRARFDLAAFSFDAVVDARGHEHIAIKLGAHLCRIDIVGGSLLQGPAALRFHLRFASSIVAKLAALDRLLRAAGIRDPLRRAPGRDPRLPMLADAIVAMDGLASDASQYSIAATLLGDDRVADWPGDGDHLKSWVRRRIALARQLKRAGPRFILAGRH